MKKLSETYKELGIAFKFPIWIQDTNGYETYYETSNGFWNKYEYNSDGDVTYYEDSDKYWHKREYDSGGNETYFEGSDGSWHKSEYDSDGNETYYEDSDGNQRGTKRKIIKVKAELDDAAFACGDFIQKTLSILDAEFDKFFDKHKDMIEGLTEEEKHDWLSDYVWNGWDKDSHGFEETFSETLSNINGFEVNDDDNSMIEVDGKKYKLTAVKDYEYKAPEWVNWPV